MSKFNKYIQLNNEIIKNNEIINYRYELSVFENILEKIKISFVLSFLFLLTSVFILLNINDIIIFLCNDIFVLNLKYVDKTSTFELIKFTDSVLKISERAFPIILPFIFYTIGFLQFSIYNEHSFIKNTMNFKKNFSTASDQIVPFLLLITISIMAFTSLLTSFVFFAYIFVIIFISIYYIWRNINEFNKNKKRIILYKKELENKNINQNVVKNKNIKKEMNLIKNDILNNSNEMKIIAEEATNINPDCSYKKDIAISIMKEFEEINKAKQTLNEFNQKIDNVFNYEKRNSKIINE